MIATTGGMTNMPIRRTFHVPTSSPSRRRTINQRMVASEPVTDKFGPRSTPISIEPTICEGSGRRKRRSQQSAQRAGYSSDWMQARRQGPRKTLGAWLIWTIWQKSNPTLADQVTAEPRYAIFRHTGVALTKRGQTKSEAKQFVAFLTSAKGAAIFRKWG